MKWRRQLKVLIVSAHSLTHSLSCKGPPAAVCVSFEVFSFCIERDRTGEVRKWRGRGYWVLVVEEEEKEGGLAAGLGVVLVGGFRQSSSERHSTPPPSKKLFKLS